MGILVYPIIIQGKLEIVTFILFILYGQRAVQRGHTISKTVNGIMKRLKQENGLATMEFALVLPILAFLIMGIIDFGLMMTSRASMVSASREGARAGILLTDPLPTEADITSVVQNALLNAGWGAAEVAATAVTVTGAGGTTGTDVTVQLTKDHSFFVISNLIPTIPDPYTLGASTTMKHE